MTEETKPKTVRAANWFPTLDETISLFITEEVINRRLIYLGQCVDDAYEALSKADEDWTAKNTAHELAMADTRLSLIAEKSANDKPYTIPEKDDLALTRNRASYEALAIAAQVLRSAKAYVSQLETQQSNVQTIANNFRTTTKL